MLPEKLRFELFDRLSIQTMRYVKSVPRREASGLVKEVYDMIAEDFFINGSLTSHSKVPELLAGVWTGGRESMLVDDILDRTTKEAMTAVVSQMNECAYCGDMLISLVHAGDKKDEASRLFEEEEVNIADEVIREKLIWTKEVISREEGGDLPLPFPREGLPEVIAAILAISHINRFSHIVMDGSPVNPLFGSKQMKGLSLKMFGNELKSTKLSSLIPDRTANLLPKAPLPDDMTWAEGSPRIAGAVSRWAGAIEREAPRVVSDELKAFVETNLSQWDGLAMPLFTDWVEEETKSLTGHDRDVARFVLLVAKSAPLTGEELTRRVFQSEEQFIRLLAWASFSGARQVAFRVAERVKNARPETGVNGIRHEAEPVAVVG